jgi:hypothetical protein
MFLQNTGIYLQISMELQHTKFSFLLPILLLAPEMSLLTDRQTVLMTARALW